MFGEVRGAAAAITGNTFTAVTLLWMGRVKRGGKSSQVHRKVMIQTVYNRISPPTPYDDLSFSLPFSPLPTLLTLSLSLSLYLSRFNLERQTILSFLPNFRSSSTACVRVSDGIVVILGGTSTHLWRPMQLYPAYTTIRISGVEFRSLFVI